MYCTLFCHDTILILSLLVQLMKRFEALLKDWGRLLQQYLKGPEEQVDLLLTLEEFCSEEPPFGPSSQGKRFIIVFARVNFLLNTVSSLTCSIHTYLDLSLWLTSSKR